MSAPSWIESAVGEFGRAAGISGLAFNDRSCAAVRFENGIGLRFEYVGGELAMAATVRVAPDARTVRRLLSFAHPDAGGVRVRAGLLARSGEAVLAVRIPEGDVTLPVLNQTFAALWRLATEIGGAA